MATPHISGAMALLWCALPGMRHQITASRDALDNAAVHIASTLAAMRDRQTMFMDGAGWTFLPL